MNPQTNQLNNVVAISQNTTEEEKWKLCCSSLHKTEIVFFTQVIFIFILASFSIIQIINKVENSDIYFSMLSTCLGIIVPSPSLQITRNRE